MAGALAAPLAPAPSAGVLFHPASGQPTRRAATRPLGLSAPGSALRGRLRGLVCGATWLASPSLPSLMPMDDFPFPVCINRPAAGRPKRPSPIRVLRGRGLRGIFYIFFFLLKPPARPRRRALVRLRAGPRSPGRSQVPNHYARTGKENIHRQERGEARKEEGRRARAGDGEGRGGVVGRDDMSWLQAARRPAIIAIDSQTPSREHAAKDSLS